MRSPGRLYLRGDGSRLGVRGIQHQVVVTQPSYIDAVPIVKPSALALISFLSGALGFLDRPVFLDFRVSPREQPAGGDIRIDDQVDLERGWQDVPCHARVEDQRGFRLPELQENLVYLGVKLLISLGHEVDLQGGDTEGRRRFPQDTARVDDPAAGRCPEYLRDRSLAAANVTIDGTVV